MEPAPLESIPLFEGLGDDELATCAEWFDEREFVAGTSLVKQGDFSYKFFVVLEGELEVRRDFELVAELGPGDFFGEMGVKDDAPRNARVTPMTHCRLASMMTWKFREMAERFPQVAERIEAAVAARSGS